MTQLSLSDQAKFWGCYCLVKLKQLDHDTFTATELNELVADYFPLDLALPVPVGQGKLTLQSLTVSMDNPKDELQLESVASIQIKAMGNPIYRAHLLIRGHITPAYDEPNKRLYIAETALTGISLIQDEYSLLKDTQFLIDKLMPIPVAGLLTNPVRSAVNLLSRGTSEQSLQYLNLYINGSKQRILDYHQPQITAALTDLLRADKVSYTLSDDHWREKLFSRLGQKVAVANGGLQFLF